MFTSISARPGTKSRQVLHRSCALLVTFLLVFALAPALAPAANASNEELLSNSDFSKGSAGWRTNHNSQTLTILENGIAQLTTKVTGHAVLNDSPNAVTNTTKGSKYVVSARVRTTTPTVDGSLRIREVAGNSVKVSEETFRLSGTAWQDVTLNVTTIYPGSHLDFNLVARNLPVGSNLRIQNVSMKLASVPTEQPGAPVAPPASPSQCEAVPLSGTLFGTSISTRSQTFPNALKGLDSTFGKVKVIRHFSPGLPLSWSSQNAKLINDRTVVMSFKVPPAEITSGKHDAFFRNWFKTAPTNQTIYWSYFHEPENNINAGEFTTAQYRAAWTRLANLANETCKPRMHATLILTGWTMNPSSKRDYRVYDAGPQYIEVLAFDPYNGIYEDRDYYEVPSSLFGHIVTKMKSDGRPWGIAETGARRVKSDATGSKRAAWLTSMGPYLKQQKALFITYYHAHVSDGDYRLTDAPSIAAWSALVKQ